MKEFPLTEGELNELAFTGGAAAVAISFATFLFGLALDISKDLALATALPEAAEGFWGAMRVAAWVGGGIALVVAGLFFIRGWLRLAQIKRETTHD